MLTLENAISWKDSKDKGDRILAAMRMRAQEGKHMGPVRIGFLHVCRPDGTRVLEWDPVRAPLIRRLFELCATGVYSLMQLVAEAEKMGLKSKKEKKLGVSSLHGILRDPLYKGYVHFMDIIEKGDYEPIVGEELWNRVQDVLTGRNTNIAKVQDHSLRELFMFGSLIRCPKCWRVMSPYRVKGKYYYYGCKNRETKCKTHVKQDTVRKSLKGILKDVDLTSVNLEKLRELLLAQHKERSTNASARRKELNTEYERLEKQIGEAFGMLGEAEKMGITKEAKEHVQKLCTRRDEMKVQLDALHEQGTAWIEKTIGCFEMFKLLQEAIFYGSTHQRESTLTALCSKYSVESENLVCEWRTPFKQKALHPVCSEWWAGRDSNPRRRSHLIYSQARLTTSVPTHTFPV